jgi:hypothetical protein
MHCLAHEFGNKKNKFLVTYYMTYGTLMYLVKELKPFVKSKAIMFVKAPLKCKKTIELALYRFVHEVNANIIVNGFKCWNFYNV